jgi:PAS domain S-box-containing protein/putative nucleotidyltransferase with HDIG domain
MQKRSNHIRILVVEDSLVQAELLRRILVEHGFAVDYAKNGAEGLAKIKANRPDLVISDIIMPAMTGFELCQAIRREKRLQDLPFILLTSLSNLEDVLTGLESGADNFITKPYNKDQLLTIITGQLAKKTPAGLQDENGLVVTHSGQRHVIRKSPEKILDFFLSIYGIALGNNAELARTKIELEDLNKELEHKVQERALALIAEITQRQEAEMELDRSRRYQELILNAAGEGILGVDIKGRVTFANPAALKMLGYAPWDLLGQFFNQVCPFSQPDGRPVLKEGRPLQVTLLDGQRRDAEGMYSRQDGSSFPVQSTCCAITEGQEITGAVISFRDITKRKETEDALRRAFEGAVRALASAVEARDPYTSGHQLRVATLACAIAREMGLSEERVEVLRMAGVLHDIGKIQIPAEILSKPSRLSEIEFGLIKIHPQVGYNIIEAVDFPGQVADIVLQHHERMSGGGYPAGLRGEELLLESRVLAVADVVEAMVSHRPYRPGLGIEKALAEIIANKGILYDSEAVEACVKLFTVKEFSFEP